MKTVSVVAQKGGTGKTTLCLAIACAAVRDGLAAAVVDLDPQATAASWGDRRAAELPVVVPAQPPRVEQGAVAAARAADLVLIPCRPAVYDLETVAATVDVIRAVAPDTPFLCVLNGVPPRGPRQPQARAVLADLDVPVCTASLGLRAAVDYAAAAGDSAQEHQPRGKAAAEIAAVYEIVRHVAGLPASRNTRPPAGKSTCPLVEQTTLSTCGKVRLSAGREGHLRTCRNDH